MYDIITLSYEYSINMSSQGSAVRHRLCIEELSSSSDEEDDDTEASLVRPAVSKNPLTTVAVESLPAMQTLRTKKRASLHLLPTSPEQVHKKKAKDTPLQVQEQPSTTTTTTTTTSSGARNDAAVIAREQAYQDTLLRATADDGEKSTRSSTQDRILGPAAAATDSSSSSSSSSLYCWVCEVQVRGDKCLYALHTHPLLKVPVCCVCADRVLQQQQQQHDEEEDDEICSGCVHSDNSTLLVLCDSCPRAFCTNCVSQAHGGGDRDETLRLLGDETEAWSCLVCKPPRELQSMQLNTTTTTLESDTTKDQVMVSVEELLGELEVLEDELEECERSEEQEERQRELIQAEYDALSSPPPSDVHELVERELDDWIAMWTDHQYRIRDRVVFVQEELENRSISLSAFYKYRESKLSGRRPNAEATPPPWKAEADRALDQMEAPLPYSAPDPSVYDQDLEEGDYDLEIEDLQTTKDQILPDSKERGQWRHSMTKVDEIDVEKVERYRQREDEILKNSGTAVKQINNAADEREFVNERKRNTRRTGTVVIRQDAYQIALHRKKKQDRRKQGPDRGSRLAAPMPKERAAVEPPGDSRQDWNSSRKCVSSTADDSASLSLEERSESASAFAIEPGRKGIFEASPLILSKGGDGRRTISVAEPLARVLKEHQVEGIKFIWRNVCPELGYVDRKGYLQAENDGEAGGIGGCILAHNMGLGKSLQVIAFLHTLLNHPALHVEVESGLPIRLVHRALLIVPVNTLANWENEFDKWLDGLYPPTVVLNLNTGDKAQREGTVRRWARKGGVLLCSDRVYVKIHSLLINVTPPGSPALSVVKKVEELCDVVVLDEAHTMLKNLENKTFKALCTVSTVKRVALSGTPLQNSLGEYFRMASWCRPGCLGSQSYFERIYQRPIMEGLASDSSARQVREQVRLTGKLSSIMAPFMHRRDRSVLSKELPPMQQVVLHVRQSKTQARLYRAFKKKFPANDNFLKFESSVRPLHNHPACLLMSSRCSQRTIAPVSVDGKTAGEESQNSHAEISKSKVPSSANLTGPTGERSKEAWWSKAVAKRGTDELKDVENGFKIMLFLRILAHADHLGEKVVCFSQCLRTLDFIEEILNMDDWGRFVSNLTSISSGKKLGSWRKNEQYLRIDGQVSASERGDMIASFQGTEYSPDAPLHLESSNGKIFLISIKAGSLGINLTAASRVVILDNHWNPSITEQALFRCYRYGQTKPVFAYRFITEGSIEEKIYSRSVNKSGLAERVVDQRHPERFFTEKELSEVQEMDSWVQCDVCEKWRMLPPEADVENLPDLWSCEMNQFDAVNNTCNALERDTRWYTTYFHQQKIRRLESKEGEAKESLPILRESIDVSVDSTSEEKKLASIKRDVILSGLLEMGNETGLKKRQSLGTFGHTSMISKLHYHETLLEDTGADLDLEASQEEEPAALNGDRSGAQAKASADHAPGVGSASHPEHQQPIPSDYVWGTTSKKNLFPGEGSQSEPASKAEKARSMPEVDLDCELSPCVTTPRKRQLSPTPLRRAADKSLLSKVRNGKNESPSGKVKGSTKDVVAETRARTPTPLSIRSKKSRPSPRKLPAPTNSSGQSSKAHVPSPPSKSLASRATIVHEGRIVDAGRPVKQRTLTKKSMYEVLLCSSSDEDEGIATAAVAAPGILRGSPQRSKNYRSTQSGGKLAKSGAFANDAIDLTI